MKDAPKIIEEANTTDPATLGRTGQLRKYASGASGVDALEYKGVTLVNDSTGYVAPGFDETRKLPLFWNAN